MDKVIDVEAVNIVAHDDIDKSDAGANAGSVELTTSAGATG